MKLHFFYIIMNADGIKKKYTIVTPDEHYFINQTKESPTLIPVHFTLYQQVQHMIDDRNDPILFSIATEKFLSSSILRYDDFISFNDIIDKPSFKKEMLLSANLYKPENEFEQFLAQHHILQAYYLKKIQFIIQSHRSEYSRANGTREFNHEYTTNRIDWELIQGEKSHHHSRDLYTSDSQQKLLSFHGINDLGNKINVKHIIPSSGVKMLF